MGDVNVAKTPQSFESSSSRGYFNIQIIDRSGFAPLPPLVFNNKKATRGRLFNVQHLAGRGQSW